MMVERGNSGEFEVIVEGGSFRPIRVGLVVRNGVDE